MLFLTFCSVLFCSVLMMTYDVRACSTWGSAVEVVCVYACVCACMRVCVRVRESGEKLVDTSEDRMQKRTGCNKKKGHYKFY